MCVTGCVSKEKKRQDRKRIEEGREFSPSLFRSTKSKRVKRSKMIEKKTLFKPFLVYSFFKGKETHSSVQKKSSLYWYLYKIILFCDILGEFLI
jgi:hypothetical protein